MTMRIVVTVIMQLAVITARRLTLQLIAAAVVTVTVQLTVISLDGLTDRTTGCRAHSRATLDLITSRATRGAGKSQVMVCYLYECF